MFFGDRSFYGIKYVLIDLVFWVEYILRAEQAGIFRFPYLLLSAFYSYLLDHWSKSSVISVNFTYNLAESSVSPVHADEARMTATGMDSTPQDIGHRLPCETKDFEVRKLELRDLECVAQLHAAVFQEYFLTHLGQEVLQAFYSGFIRAISLLPGLTGQS
jgi:hypothetical protein